MRSAHEWVVSWWHYPEDGPPCVMEEHFFHHTSAVSFAETLGDGAPHFAVILELVYETEDGENYHDYS